MDFSLGSGFASDYSGAMEIARKRAFYITSIRANLFSFEYIR